MSKYNHIFSFLVPLCLVLLLTAEEASSQPQQSGSPPQGQEMDQNTRTGPPTAQRGQGAEQMQNMMTERFKELLGCSDEEWQVIGPKVLNVFRLSSRSSGSGMRMILGRANNRGDQSTNRRGQVFGSQGDETLTKLQELLENEDATTSEIKRLVSEVRKAREKSEQELATARKELRELLTVRQEAILITTGVLD